MVKNFRYSVTTVWTIDEVAADDQGEYRCVVISDYGNYSVATFLEARGSFLISQIFPNFSIFRASKKLFHDLILLCS